MFVSSVLKAALLMAVASADEMKPDIVKTFKGPGASLMNQGVTDYTLTLTKVQEFNKIKGTIEATFTVDEKMFNPATAK